MPWQTPTLKEVRSTVRDMIRGSLPGADAAIPNSVLRVLSDNQGALAHLTLQYIDWLALQLIPDTAETEWLDRHGDIWLTNSDGSTGRKMATLATGTAEFTSLATAIGTGIIPASSRLTFATGVGLEYETTAEIYVPSSGAPAPGPIRALTPGVSGNRNPGDTLTLVDQPPNISPAAIVIDINNGVDTENDDDLRFRVLQRIRQPPMGGAKHDYERWTLACPGVTRAWCGPLEMGIGTVTTRFVMDELRADDDGWPTTNDIEIVRAYVDTVRPVAVKDFWVLAPIKQYIDVYIEHLVPDTNETRAEIEASLRQMLRYYGAPGQTIFAAWKSYAIMSAPTVVSFRMANDLDDVMDSPGHMAVLGDIVYA